ncbi:GntR family transcriptional regulator [Dactylosporangium sp. CA-092794]|uniref:GntR family transcriptional regulator n=1 Tax=Dactylosporangium sp. CA-092794 TaxID=3239929 RepID=UPI003D917B79
MVMEQGAVKQVDGMADLSMTDRVYALLKEEIIRVDRKPGDLLGEGDLAERFGVSKTPVREALRLLAREGWVRVLPRKGYLIRPLRLEDVREIFEMRLALEPVLAAQAAATASAESVQRLRGLVDSQANAGSAGEALDAARAFHIAVADLVGNGRMSQALFDLLDEVRRLHFLLPNVESHITSDEEVRAHRRLVVALRAKDAEKSADIMRRHLNEVARTLVRGFGGI